jgi:hypothetical protein
VARVPLYKDILQNIPYLPDDARIPVPCAAVYAGISRDEIKKRYPLVKLGMRRVGVLLGDLRSKREVTA